jgi:hypothetical protein
MMNPRNDPHYIPAVAFIGGFLWCALLAYLLMVWAPHQDAKAHKLVSQEQKK